MIKTLLVSLTAASALLFAGTAAADERIVCFPNGQCIDLGDIGTHP
ncbi:hypothetical protein GR157_34005 [Burkholderia sp. 4701]|nr:hypothetical protein [Burkholderia sp. 4701]MXN86750.1 hypothetical protein [Burkholderia sp. 4812]